MNPFSCCCSSHFFLTMEKCSICSAAGSRLVGKKTTPLFQQFIKEVTGIELSPPFHVCKTHENEFYRSAWRPRTTFKEMATSEEYLHEKSEEVIYFLFWGTWVVSSKQLQKEKENTVKFLQFLQYFFYLLEMKVRKRSACL